MIFDVMVREGHNADGKPIYNVKRVHDSELSAMVRKMQDEEIYVHSIIPLFRQKREQVTIATGPEVEEEQIQIAEHEVVDNFDGY